MITITPANGNYIMTTSDKNEKATIDKMLSKHNRKLERHIETYLQERKVNIREQENMLIMKHMTEAERLQRLNEIEQAEKEKDA
jgi:hypothetical protein